MRNDQIELFGPLRSGYRKEDRPPAFATLAEVDAAWSRYFPDSPDWRDVSDEFGLPGYLSTVDGNIARDQHLVRSTIDLVQQGERVFVVAGVSHPVKIEAALNARFSE